MSLPSTEYEPRRAVRETLACPARIWGFTMPPSDVVVVNLSANGCMLQSDMPASIGESLTLELPDLGSLRGVVIWSTGARIGLEFEALIPQDAYLPFLERHQDRSEG